MYPEYDMVFGFSLTFLSDFLERIWILVLVLFSRSFHNWRVGIWVYASLWNQMSWKEKKGVNNSITTNSAFFTRNTFLCVFYSKYVMIFWFWQCTTHFASSKLYYHYSYDMWFIHFILEDKHLDMIGIDNCVPTFGSQQQITVHAILQHFSFFADCFLT